MLLFYGNQLGHRLVKDLAPWTTREGGVYRRSWNHDRHVSRTLWHGLLRNARLGIRLKVRCMIQGFIGVFELRFGSVNLEKMTSEISSIRNFRANHLGSNLHPGAEAQFIHHAVQARRQRFVLQLQRPCPQLRSFHPFLQGIDVGPLMIDSPEELILFLVDVGVPRPVAICHGLSIRFDLG